MVRIHTTAATALESQILTRKQGGTDPKLTQAKSRPGTTILSTRLSCNNGYRIRGYIDRGKICRQFRLLTWNYFIGLFI